MKKLIIILLLLLLSLSVVAQEQFEGKWINPKQTSYTTTILASKYSVVEVFSFSFLENKTLKEHIINQSDNELNTRLYNKSNGYKININYTLKSPNIMIMDITGDTNRRVLLTKQTNN